MPSRLTKPLSLFICFSLIFEQSVFAQSLDLSAHFANFGRSIPQSDKFRPLHLRYLGYDNLSQDFKLFLDKGDTRKEDLENKAYIEENTQTLLKYFFIGLTLPNDKFWVNLRPDSPDNILDPDLERTDIGRIFLEADLQLKKDTAQWTSPQTKEGKEYWDKLYKKAGELFGTENITIPTITRPWIVPNEIIIREASDNAYIYKATLKVMLEEDYLDNQKTEKLKNQKTADNFSDPRLKQLNEYSTQLIRETIIPKLTYEVNTSKRYAQLRQVYYSLILAQWFKARFGKPVSQLASKPVNPLTGKPANPYIELIDSRDLTNLASKEPYDKQTYFKQYQKSFKDGEYNLSEPVYTPFGQSIRRYMSGGMGFQGIYPLSLIIPGGEKIPVKIGNVVGVMVSSSLSKSSGGKRNSLLLFVGNIVLTITSLVVDPNRIFAENYADHRLTERGIESTIVAAEGDTVKKILENIAFYNDVPLSTYYKIAKELKEKIIEENPEIDMDDIPPGARLKHSSATEFLLLQDALSLEVIAQRDVYMDGKKIKIYFVNSAYDERPGRMGLSFGGDTIIVDVVEAIRGARIKLWVRKKMGDPIDSPDPVDEAMDMVKDTIYHELIHLSEFNKMILEGSMNNDALKKIPFFRDFSTKDEKDELIKKRILQEFSAHLWAIAKSKNPLDILEMIDKLFKESSSSDRIYRSVARVFRGLVCDNIYAKDPAVDYSDKQDFFWQRHEEYIEYLRKNVTPKTIRDHCSIIFVSIFGKVPEEKEIDLAEIKKYIEYTLENKRLVKISGEMLKQVFGGKEDVWIEGNTVEEMLEYVQKEAVEKGLILNPAGIKVYSHGKEIQDGFVPGYVVLKSTGSSPVEKSNKNKSLGPTTYKSNAPTAKKGGIDFHFLPIVTQAITNLSSGLLMPSSYSSLRQLNLSQERQAIEGLASSGITPSPERLKSFLQASCLQDKLGEDKDKTLTLLSELLRQQEFSLQPTQPGLTDILVVLESSTSSQQLKEIFLGR